MKPERKFTSCNHVRMMLVLLFIGYLLPAEGQEKMKRTSVAHQPVYETQQLVHADTFPKTMTRFSDAWLINRQIKMKRYPNNGAVDTVNSLDPFLQLKAGCETVKALGEDGSILIRYPDGFTKKMYDGLLVEVITADGVRHVPSRRPFKPTLYLDIIRIPPPVPGASDPIFKWLADFRQGLESDIRDLIGEKSWSQFLGDEAETCGDNIYKQIQFRTKFLENYSTAH